MASDEKLIQRMLQAAQRSGGPQEMGPEAGDYDHLPLVVDVALR